MIQRINLIEKQALNFSYEKIVQFFALIVVLNILFGAYPFILASRMHPKISTAQTRLDAVMAENTALTTKQKKPQKKRVSIGEYQQLFDTLQALPKWSKLVKIVSVNLPSSVWINSLRTAGSAQTKKEAVASEMQKKGISGDLKKTQDKMDAVEGSIVSKNRIEISGVGTDVKSITEFVAKLSRSPAFTNLQLLESVRENYGYKFTIQSEVMTDYVEQ